jgi:2,3-bisphosphoglycerate-dependent phosphoglycerate mutase
MPVKLVFETHSWSTDNDARIASGWNDGQLSERGRALAKELGRRRRGDVVDAIFSSDLQRAVETVVIAFSGVRTPIYFDPRLRECNYGDWNGSQVTNLLGRRRQFITTPYPNGQSYQDVARTMAEFLSEVLRNWAGRSILVIGHAATRWALDVLVNHERLEDLVDAPFDWQAGWTYTLQTDRRTFTSPACGTEPAPDLIRGRRASGGG